MLNFLFYWWDGSVCSFPPEGFLKRSQVTKDKPNARLVLFSGNIRFELAESKLESVIEKCAFPVEANCNCSKFNLCAQNPNFVHISKNSCVHLVRRPFHHAMCTM